jgi:hypothetical protein
MEPPCTKRAVRPRPRSSAASEPDRAPRCASWLLRNLLRPEAASDQQQKRPGAQPEAGAARRWAGARTLRWGPGPGPDVRKLTGKRLTTPAKREPGRDSASGDLGSRCGTCNCVRVFCATRGTGRFRRGTRSLRNFKAACPGPGHARSRPAGFVPSAPLVPVALPRVGGGHT